MSAVGIRSEPQDDALAIQSNVTIYYIPKTSCFGVAVSRNGLNLAQVRRIVGEVGSRDGKKDRVSTERGRVQC